MPTPIFVCGGECGVSFNSGFGGAVPHWSSLAGTPTFEAAPASRGGLAIRINPSAATEHLTTNFTPVASPATMVLRFYLYFTTLPNANTHLVTCVESGGNAGLYWDNAAGKLKGGDTFASMASDGFVPSTGVWYRIDMKCVLDATRTVDFTVDGVAQTQFVSAPAASCTGVRVGSSTVSTTSDFYVDDLIVSTTSGDYPIGVGRVAGLYPNADGTHNYSASTDFAKAGTANTACAFPVANETTSWQSLKNPLSLTIDNTKFITDLLGASTEYMEWAFDDLPAAASVNGVNVITANHSASATANNISARINDNGTTSAVYTALDMSETTIVIQQKLFAVAPSTSAAWTKTLVDGLKFQWGLSTDVNPDPILDGVCFEVDYVPAAPYDGLPPVAIIAPSVAAQRASRW